VKVKETKMPSANVYDREGRVVRQHELDPYVFGAPINMGLLHQVVTAQLVNRRQGNADTKTRSEVSGGNKKPYRQKGTGRARQGSTRAPHYVGGGTVFGPQPHAYERHIPRKMKRRAIRGALSDKAANGRILLMDALTFDEPHTRAMVEFLERLPLERKLLVLMPQRDENVSLSARNIQRIKVDHVSAINVVELLKYDHLLLPLPAVERIVAMFGEEADDRLQLKRHPRVVYRKRARLAAAAERAASQAAAVAPRAPTTTTPETPGAAKAPRTRAPKAAAAPAAPTPPAAEAAETAKPAKPTRRRTRTPEQTTEE
jgi:large subunit ribosomal protein L4